MPTEEIPDDIAALLRDARATDVPAAGAQARQWAKTMGRSDSPGPGNGTPTAAPATVASTALLASFAAGVLCGIVGTVVVVTLLAAPPKVYVPVPVPAVQSSPARVAVAPAPAVTPLPIVVKPASAPVAAAIPASSAHESHTTERATERAWLDAARTALSEHDFDSATSNLETAGARFPDGALSEEREALAIHVLIARGDQKLAELAINTFRARRPGSPFVLAIEEAMQQMEATR